MKNVAAVDFAGQSYLFFVDGSQISFYAGPAGSENSSELSYDRFSFNMDNVKTHPSFYKIAAVSWKTANGAEVSSCLRIHRNIPKLIAYCQLRLYYANGDGDLLEITRSSGPDGLSGWNWGKLQNEDYGVDPDKSGLSAIVNDSMTKLYFTPPKAKTVWVAFSNTGKANWNLKAMVKLSKV